MILIAGAAALLPSLPSKLARLVDGLGGRYHPGSTYARSRYSLNPDIFVFKSDSYSRVSGSEMVDKFPSCNYLLFIVSSNLPVQIELFP